MAEVILKNISELSADYDDEPITFVTNEVSTIVVSGITAQKAVDKAYWVNGPLKYTITVTNNSGVNLDNITLIDTLSELVAVDQTFGVRIDDVSTPYTFLSHVLSVPLPAIEDGVAVAVTFQVLQV